MRSIHWRHPLSFTLSCLALTLALGLSPTAHAGQVTLSLSNGGAISGEIVRVRPKRWVKVRLPSGLVETLRWNELLDPPPELTAPPPALQAIPGGTPPGAAAPGTTAPGAAAPAATAPPAGASPAYPYAPEDPDASLDAVMTHVQSDRHGIKLLRVQARDWIYAGGYGRRSVSRRRVYIDSLESVCTAPCSVPADTQAAYRVGGEGFTPSRAFFLPSSGPVTIDVRAGLLSRHRAGVGLTYTGFALSFLGATVCAAVGAASASVAADPGVVRSAYATGGVFLGVGTALLVPGIVLWATSRTHVAVEGGSKLGRLHLGPQGLAF